jgi:hypothetical protein
MTVVVALVFDGLLILIGRMIMPWTAAQKLEVGARVS